jgi:hypothetical protein
MTNKRKGLILNASYNTSLLVNFQVFLYIPINTTFTYIRIAINIKVIIIKSGNYNLFNKAKAY